MSNANADVSSPLDPVRINTSQSEPSDTVARVPRFQGSATAVDIPGRRLPPFNAGIPDQHSNAAHPRVNIPGRRSPLFNVGYPDKHASATQPWVDIPGRRQTSQAFHVDIQDQHSSAIYPRVNSPGRRQSSPEFGVDHRDRNNRDPINVCSPGRRFRVPDSISHDRDDYSHPSSRRLTFLVDVDVYPVIRYHFLIFPCIIRTEILTNRGILKMTWRDVLVHQIALSQQIVEILVYILVIETLEVSVQQLVVPTAEIE